MIDGFETRENTDIPVRALVNSAKGHLYKRPSTTVGQYETTKWDYDRSFKNPITVFGMLRGTAQLIEECSRLNQDFYYFDHAYLFGNKHNPSKIFNEKIYRLTKNYFHIRDMKKLSDDDYKRIEKYEEHVQLEPWKKDGKYVLVFEPSDFAKKWWDVPDWTEDTIKMLKKNTDLEIRIRKKNSLISFESEVKNAKCVISLQSAAAVQSLIWGIPSYCGEMSAAYPISLDVKTFEKGTDSIQYIPDSSRQMWLNSVLANQYTMTEIADGTCYNRLKNK